ncbi:MAG: amino acid permease [Salinivirgaceae bacterium]|jgi:amino acid transporter|nr:amino acid permease [Salinivirgaceae bacterium]
MNSDSSKKFGTAPVFFTAISTILGAILFLRFGFAVGSIGFWGIILIILLGHLVTIPTALALSEIATNKRVEGGGEYFIISRSFGLNIGATIGIALYISQAISVAFYIIAFTEAFDFVFIRIDDPVQLMWVRKAISLGAMTILTLLILKRGANMGVKVLYYVVAILGISLVMFFLGSTEFSEASTFSIRTAELRNMDNFFVVFAIVFPAFTGMTAGVGLSGDLKKPSKSIPLGTTAGTLIGMLVYFFIVYKLASSASIEDLTNNQLIMAKIAIGGVFIIPLGLAASTISSALGSIMVAPRTLQALALDKAFPIKRLNFWVAKERIKDKEPINASIITILIAYVFVAAGDVNFVAEIISMFFMVTYGSLCLISFLNHFGASPSYRPSFRSKWYLSLIGFIVAVWVMFKINTPYALTAFAFMTLIYLYINSYHKTRKGFEGLYANSIYQLSRNLQVFVQKHRSKKEQSEWRPSAICISKATFERNNALILLDWISHKFGFGTYLHHINGYYSKATHDQAETDLEKIINKVRRKDSHVYVDTIISPSNTSAIAQAIQIPGIAGMENNMIIFEFDKNNMTNLPEIIDNIALVAAGNFDIAILASSQKPIQYKTGIHIWIKTADAENSNLLLLLSFIILGHKDWRKSDIKIFEIVKPSEIKEAKQRMKDLVLNGRLPIIENNIEIIAQQDDISPKTLINEKSKDAGFTLIGFREETLKHEKQDLLNGYDDLGNILFINSNNQKVIE